MTDAKTSAAAKNSATVNKLDAEPVEIQSLSGSNEKNNSSSFDLAAAISSILGEPAFVEGVRAMVKDALAATAEGDAQAVRELVKTALEGTSASASIDLRGDDFKNAVMLVIDERQGEGALFTQDGARAFVESKIKDMAESGALIAAYKTAEAAREEREHADGEAERLRHAKALARSEAASKKANADAAAAASRAADARVTKATADYAAVVALLPSDDDDEDDGHAKSVGATELRLGRGGHVVVRLAEAGRFLPEMSPIAVDPKQLSMSGGRATLNLDIAPDPEMPPATVTEVWLIGDEGPSALRCEVPAGLPVGGGREATLRAGSLVF